MAFTLDVAAQPDSSGWRLQLYFRVPPATLRQLGTDEQGNGHLRATVRVRGNFGAKKVERVEEFTIPQASAAGGYGKVLLLQFPAGPGPCRVWARLEDPLTRKRGIAYSARSTSEFVVVEGDVDVPAPQAGRDLSDLQFLWPDSADAGAAFRQGGRSALPNPERLYGLLAPELRAGFLARASDARPWRWLARVYDDSARVVAQRESTGVAGLTMWATCAFDLATERAGGYTLEVKAWQDGDAGALLRRSRFSLAWQPETWFRAAGELTDEAHFLLQSEHEEEFQRRQPGEQEAYLDAYWRRRDPTPGTALNEALETFRSRVTYANRTFTRFGLDKGMYSDMGRTYIRYGEPSEILKQVLPAGDDDLVRVIGEIAAEEDRAVGVAQKRGDQRAWEVWVYEGDIAPPIDADPGESSGARGRRRLLFLFVDEQGIGNFTLRYSTE